MEELEKNQLSDAAKAAWDQLDARTRKEIQKTNPLKVIRNRRIRELKANGVKAEILAEITGLSPSSIFRAIKQEAAIPDYAKEEVKGLTRAFESFLKSLSKILNDNFKGRDEKVQS